MIYNWFFTFWISTQCSSLPSLRDLEMTVCMCMYMCIMFVLKNLHLLSCLSQAIGEVSLFNILHDLASFHFFPLWFLKSQWVGFFACLSPVYHRFENPVWPPVRSLTSARPLGVQRHLQALQKALSWEHFTLSLMYWSEAGGGEPCGAAGKAVPSKGASRQMDPPSCRGPRVWPGGKWELPH